MLVTCANRLTSTTRQHVEVLSPRKSENGRRTAGVLHRSGYEVTLIHAVRPPWCLAVVEVVAGLAGYVGGSCVRRWLHVEAFRDGDLYRVTIGDIARGGRRSARGRFPMGWLRETARHTERLSSIDTVGAAVTFLVP